MKNLLYVMAGILLVMLTSATTVSVMTVKPATPKETLVKSFKSEGNSEDVAKYIHYQIQKGWQFKEVTGANCSSTYSTWIVVMEKY